MTTSLFQNVEIEAEAVEAAIVADFQIAWAHIEDFYSKDVKPIVSATLQYIETNGATELLILAKNAVLAGVAAIEGDIPNLGEFLVAMAGTIFDEAKSAGIAVAEGAAHLAASMAYATVTAPTVAVPAPTEAPQPTAAPEALEAPAPEEGPQG